MATRHYYHNFQKILQVKANPNLDLRDASDELQEILRFSDDGKPSWMTMKQKEFFESTKKDTALLQVFEQFPKKEDSESKPDKKGMFTSERFVTR